MQTIISKNQSWYIKNISLIDKFSRILLCNN